MKSKKVLIVEDNELNRKLFESLVGQYWKYETATNGIEAIEWLEKESFDLILMDIQMPKMDGISALRKINQLELKQCPVIAISAFAEESNRRNFLELGFSDFITKPIRPKQFLENLKTHLSQEIEKDIAEEAPKIENILLDFGIVSQLMKYNSKEKIQIVFDDFVIEINELIEKSQDALKAKSKDSLTETFHILKGNSGTIGANSIYSLSIKLEKFLQDADWPNLEDTFSKLKIEKEKFEKYIKEETTFEP
jgi:CheY-like chemotaxis protein